MPKPIDPDAWRPRKPPIEGREFSTSGAVGAATIGWLWRHKKMSAALTVLLALLVVAAVALALLRVTGNTPPPAQTGPTPTLLPANR
jgi:hypothetical protein